MSIAASSVTVIPTSVKGEAAPISCFAVALAKAWLIPVKKLVGYLSNLIDCQVPDIQHTGSKYEYAVECPRHKTLKKRLEALAKVAELDLGGMPFKR